MSYYHPISAQASRAVSSLEFSELNIVFISHTTNLFRKIIYTRSIRLSRLNVRKIYNYAINGLGCVSSGS
jgi:hypothetical protein